MATVNYTNYNIDQTVRVFDSFYKFDVNVPADQYDIVFSWFKTQMGTTQAAENFTVSVFRIAQETKIPALTLLQYFQDEGKTQTSMVLDVQLAYWLNQIRSRATLLGVSVPAQPNYYAARNIVL